MNDPTPVDLGVCRRRILFYGHVQGVGFRYTVVAIAKDFAVNGYVRNAPNGSVELIAQGTGPDIDRFVARIEASFRDYIERQTSEEITTCESYAGFEIRR